MSVDWQTASERLNRFARLDPGLRQQLNALRKAEARDDKIAFKLEEGSLRHETAVLRQQAEKGSG